ncbi:MAG: right-handed parallel beta-helix repeat-containing protein [Streptosporangiaceae bacterium]
MTRRRKHQDGLGGPRRSWPAVLAALAFFGLLASTSIILTTLHLHLEPVAAASSHGVPLLTAPRNLPPVALPAVAQPIDPGQPPASLPAVNSAKETAGVAAEDGRIRVLLHDAVRTYQPDVIAYRGALPTLVLPASSHAYTAADLVQYGALIMLANKSALLLDNIFVSANALLSLGSPTLDALYMDSTSGGFATIVAWGGNLSFTGTPSQPFTIMGWDRATRSPAADAGDGRSYLREVGGTMTLTDVRASSLGFWSGRTGGVAWTGVSGAASKGGATASTFTDDTYGAFVSRGQGVTFTSDLFEFNELDGLHIHRYSVGSQVTSSSAARNGGNGFLVDRATQNTTLKGDVSEHNAANGYFIDGRPLVSGASASGGSVQPGSGTVLDGSAATGNAHTGILVEGGTGTVIKATQVCATTTAIGVRAGAVNSVLTGNYIGCHPQSGLSVGPAAPGTVISGNSLSDPRVGVLIRGSGPVELDNNRIIGATVFGVTARGAASQVKGVGNVLSGTGFRAVDARADAAPPALSGTDTSGWAHHAEVTFLSYLEFHPLAALWLGILVVVIIAAAWSFRRRLPPHPYPVSTRWRGAAPEAEETRPVLDPGPAWPPRQPQRPAAPAARHARASWDPAAPAWDRAAGQETTPERPPAARPEPPRRREPVFRPHPAPGREPVSSAPPPAERGAVFRPNPAYEREPASRASPSAERGAVFRPNPAYEAESASWAPPPAERRAVFRPNPAYERESASRALPPAGRSTVSRPRPEPARVEGPARPARSAWRDSPARADPEPALAAAWEDPFSLPAERFPAPAAERYPAAHSEPPWPAVPAQPRGGWPRQSDRETARERADSTRPMPKVPDR